jgi:DNA-binding transcriptional ArsR family regulator
MGQLRELLDGQFDKSWGTGKSLTWEGRLSFVAGVTEAIDEHHAVMGALGPRFLLLRMQLPNRKAVARAAMRNRNIAEAKRAAQKTVTDFFRGVSTRTPRTPDHIEHRLTDIADFITQARSVVQKDDRGEPEYAPPPEGPGRFIRQLHGLAMGLAVINGRDEISDGDIDLVERVAFDCLPPTRRLIIEALRHLKRSQGVPISIIEELTKQRVARRTLERELRALQLLQIVDEADGGWMLKKGRD